MGSDYPCGGEAGFFRGTSRTGNPACGFRISGDCRISGDANGVDQLRLDVVQNRRTVPHGRVLFFLHACFFYRLWTLMNANLCDDGDQLWGFHFSVFLTLIRVHLRHPWFIHSLPTSMRTGAPLGVVLLRLVSLIISSVDKSSLKSLRINFRYLKFSWLLFLRLGG